MASTPPDLDIHQSSLRLSDATLSFPLRLTHAIELRDSLEFFPPSSALDTLLLSCIEILRSPPAFVKDSAEVKFRLVVIAIVQRLPIQQQQGQGQQQGKGKFLSELVQVCVEVVRGDNEEMGVAAVKIVIDMALFPLPQPSALLLLPLPSSLSTQPPSVTPSLPPPQLTLPVRAYKSECDENGGIRLLMELVESMYTVLPDTVSELFGDERGQGAREPFRPPVSAEDPLNSAAPEMLLPAVKSFKVLTECPIAIVCILQAFPALVDEFMQRLAPLSVKCVNVETRPQARAHSEARERGEVCVTIDPAIRNRTLFADYIAAQIKLVSLIVYTVRSNAERLNGMLGDVAAGCTRLLKDCPAESSTARKELLVAVRHIMSKELRGAFSAHIDELLDERVIIGRGITTRETLKSMAVTFLQDLLSSIRESLSPSQLTTAIEVYLAWMHDPTMSVNSHLQCVSLVIRLFERITYAVKLDPAPINAEEALKLSSRCIEAFVARLETLQVVKNDLIASGILSDPRKKAVSTTESENEASRMDIDEPAPAIKPMCAADIEKAKPVAGALPTDTSPDPVKDCRSLFRMILQGLVWLVKSHKTLVEGANLDVHTMSRIFKCGFDCFFGFVDRRTDKDGGESLEFVVVLLQLADPLTFQSVVSANFPSFIEAALSHNQSAMYACKLLLTKEPTQVFLGILLEYLVENLEKVGSADEEQSQLVIHLYRLIFSAIQAEGNEQVLVPHLEYILLSSLKLAACADVPINYYTLLRHLSNAIGGGRFESFHLVVQPLLTTYLNNLRVLLDGASKSERDPLILLFLILPVRLQLIIPYMQFLVRPLGIAFMESGDEVVAQGLRTLELCIDNLNPVYLDPVFAPFFREVQNGLWRLLKPADSQNSPFAHQALIILGKLGGRNRKHLSLPSEIAYHVVSEESSLSLKMGGIQKPQIIGIASAVTLSSKMIQDGNSQEKLLAFEVLKHAVLLLLAQNVSGRGRENVYEEALTGLFSAIHEDEIGPISQQLLRDIAHTVFSQDSSLDMQMLRVTPSISVFIEVMASSLASSERKKDELSRKQVVLILTDMVNYFKRLDETQPSSSPSTRGPRMMGYLLHHTATRFSALCHNSLWSKKTAGLVGIDILINTLELDLSWVIARQVEFMRAAFFMLKDMHTDPPKNFRDVTKMIIRVLELCHSQAAQESDSSSATDKQTTLTCVVILLMSELTSVRPIARQTAQDCLALVAKLNKKEVTDLLVPTHRTLSMSIFSKPLRALPVPMQTSRIDAVTYCLSLRPPILENGEELVRFVMEVLGIAEAEDAAHIGKAPSHSWMLALEDLRVAAIKLLAATTSIPENFTNTNQIMRSRIITVYFKFLTSKPKDLVAASQQGIQQVLAPSGKVPKELLQTALKPILVHLADPKSITLEALNSLARLLELLPNYFKREIGSKLLEHFGALLDTMRINLSVPPGPSSLIPGASLGAFDYMQDVKVMSAIVHIFGLLPSSANIYLEKLVGLVADAELKLRRILDSPFTKSLAPFLARNAAEANDIILKHIFENHDIHWVITYRHILALPEALEIRSDLVQRKASFVPYLLNTDAPLLVNAALEIVKQLLAADSQFVANSPDISSTLRDLWSNYMKGDGLDFPNETKLLLEVLLDANQGDVDIETAFSLTQVFSMSVPLSPARLNRFLYKSVAMAPSVHFRRSLLEHFIKIFYNETVPQPHKAQALRYIVNPLLLYSFSDGTNSEGLIDSNLINELSIKVWTPVLDDEFRAACCSEDDLLIELMHMSTLLIQHKADVIEQTEAKNILIKFGWVGVRVEEAFVRQVSYIMIARFVEKFEIPVRMVLQCFVSLLRSHQAEQKHLVRQALDIFTPNMPKRCPAPDVNGHPVWAIWCRKVINEDSQSISQISNIYSLLIRHSDLFYPMRELFVSAMVNSLPKLGLTASTNNDTRTLAIEILELILKWEKQRCSEEATLDADTATLKENTLKRNSPSSEQPASKRFKSDSDASAPESSAREYTPTLATRGQVISFLVRHICSSAEHFSRKGLTARALDLLSGFLGMGNWNVTAKLGYYNRGLVQTDINEANIPQISNTLEVLTLVIQSESDLWFLQNLEELAKLLDRSLNSKEAKLHDSMKELLKRIFQVTSTANPEDLELQRQLQVFREWYDKIISEGIKSADSPASVFVLLSTLSAARADLIDPYLSALIRNLTKLVKEHNSVSVSPQVSQSTSNGTIVLPTSAEDEQVALNSLILNLELASSRVAELKDLRRYFLMALVQLIDKSNSTKVCSVILELLKKWITEKSQFPTTKEKAGLLLKWMSAENAENRKEQFVSVTEGYLKLILSIYTDSSLARTDLTVRMEPAFLMGCRSENFELRNQFLDILDQSMAPTLSTRLQYVIGIQNWESLADHYWLHQALHILLGSVDLEQKLIQSGNDLLLSGPLKAITDASTVKNFVNPLRNLLHSDANVTHEIWIVVFRMAWNCMTRADQALFTRQLVNLLAKEYHIKQVDKRPNVINTILTGLVGCNPPISLPPHLIKYLGKTYGVWHSAMELLQHSTEFGKEPEAIRETALDALAEIYADLSEDDLFYGLWRRRSLFDDTNAAISYEQNGMWSQAQIMYESAQHKARSGSLAFSDSEHSVWEDHWILCSQKLQQWDLLTELAKQEGNTDLLLECAWRNSNWSDDRSTLEKAFESMNDTQTPRRRVFESYLSLLRSHDESSSTTVFEKINEEAKQLSLRKWHSLPTIPGPAHIPLLHLFQQFVELGEAKNIFSSFRETRAENLDQRSSELKNTLQTWRERLPNIWDDINLWSDLVAWRTHVFQAVNKVYIPLVNALQQSQGNSAPSNGANSFGYRGFHEMAWTINRFAHTARKHQIQEVCISSLTKIYTLPNIEIQEAFLKLREQARCLYQTSDDLASGLEVINNTNLLYFSSSQKAEFFTLKGMFSAKLGLRDDATSSFTQAVQTDLNMPKAWVEWGKYNDQEFKAMPDNYNMAANAVSCYLQAAGLYKNSKSRKLLARVLWLLSLDDKNLLISKAFENFTGEAPVWYWITLIPQLLLSLSHREARHARALLIQIARKYPQALFFQLRTTKEEHETSAKSARLALERNEAAKVAALANAESSQDPSLSKIGSSGDKLASAITPSQTSATSAGSDPTINLKKAQQTSTWDAAQQNATGSITTQSPQPPPTPSLSAATPEQSHSGAAPFGSSSTGSLNGNVQARPPLEYVEEVLTMLKTAYPLLTLSLETMVDQIGQRFKPTVEEEAYRMISVLLQDAVQQYVRRSCDPNDELKLAPTTRITLEGVATNPALAPAFHDDLLKEPINLLQLVDKLRRWRSRFEGILDSRPRVQHLQSSRRHLAEFHHTKYDAVFIPGQYLKHEDDELQFQQIARFSPRIEFFRGHSQFLKRLTLISPNGLTQSFHVHLPTPRSCRREEALQQLFRIFNSVLERRKESRKRGLFFTLPAAIPLSPAMRLVQSDSSFVSLDDVFENHCHEIGIDRLDPTILWITKLAKLCEGRDVPRGDPTLVNIKLDLFAEIQSKMSPEDMLSKYMARTAMTPSNLWQLRKQFTLQYAPLIFLTFVMSLSRRDPHRIQISRASGAVQTADMFSSFSVHDAVMENVELVPFRLTPNLQHFIGPIGVEGVLTSSIMSIGRGLTDPLFDLENQLPLFIREDVVTWYAAKKRNGPEHEIRRTIQANVDRINSRAQLLACEYERDKAPNSSINTNADMLKPVCQSLVTLLSQATNPQLLAGMEPLFAAWI